MSRNVEYQFISTDTASLVAQMVSVYETITGITVRPASPEKLFIQWVAHIVLQERVLNNYTGNQNIPSRAEGENLDALAELFYLSERPEAQAAVTTERFYVSEPQGFAILVPTGTRVTDANNTLIWETTEDIYIPAGEWYADTELRCQTAGTIGNGFAEGQLNTIVDVFEYYDHCENITVSDDGAERATDDEFYELMRESMHAYSTAGSKGGYVYWAKTVSTEIADVIANSPVPGEVALYVLMDDGTIATQEIKDAVLETCNGDAVRPFTDLVYVRDPEVVTYDIDLTYYIPRDGSISSSDAREAVDIAIQEYITWQQSKLGRDINPSYLIGLLMRTGIKRVDVRSPVFTALTDGGEMQAPQVAVLGSVNTKDGGFEYD